MASKKAVVQQPPATREAWLLAAVDEMRPWFAAADLPTPASVTVSIGWPSRGALSTRNRTLGQCFGAASSIDGVPAIFVSPLLNNTKDKKGHGAGGTLRVLDVLLHELVHAVMPEGEGHGRRFAKAAKALGLEGKPTHTVAGDELKARLAKVVEKLGEIPHSALDPKTLRKPQTTRMIKAECQECGYVIRTTQKWLDVGLPTCCCGESFELA